MTIFNGSSGKKDAGMAIDEATHDWPDDFTPDILFVFYSTRQHSYSD